MGTQLPLFQKGVEPPIFGPRLLWPNGWMDQDATWCPGHSVLHGELGTQLTPQTGTAPNFWPMSIVAKRSPISATAEHLTVSAKQTPPPEYNAVVFKMLGKHQ